MTRSRPRIPALSLSLFALACAPKDGEADDFTSLTTTNSGDGDSTTGDGDGDPNPTTTTSGDGDGDPNPTTTTGDGDGDPNPTTSGDGDGDPFDGCEDGDSGLEPLDDDGLVQAPSSSDDPQPVGGTGFVPDQDVGGANECDIFSQDCIDGEKCVPYASNGGTWDANKCVPVLGDGAVGEACNYSNVVEATDDCDADSACWNIDANLMGVCTPFCEGSAQQPICDPGSTCIISNSGSVVFCVEGCNPIAQDCPAGQGCFWSGSTFSCNALTSDIQLGEPCGFINDCAEGLMCLDASVVPGCQGNACCGAFCDLDCGGVAGCAPGTVCTPFFEVDPPPGSADVGVCIAP